MTRSTRSSVTGPTDQLRRRHQRVRRALSDFDAATIATTHEFCLQMLEGLGVLGDREPGQRIVEHLTDLTHEVAGDVFLARYADGRPPMTYEEAVELAGRVVSSGHTRLVPEDSERTAYALAVRTEVERRKRDRGLFSYDDMLTRLRDALADPDHGEAACERLRRRYAIVLIDEFQDTDPVQWDILRRAFHGHATLIVIGDPKQAIYAFRGADVFSYLGAVGEAGTRATLATNWRTDRPLVDATLRLAGGAALGDERIVVRPVGSAHPERRLAGPDAGAPLRLRILPTEDDGRKRAVALLRAEIEADLVADVADLLASGQRSSGVSLRLGAGLEGESDGRPVEPSDIAILVRKNKTGESIRDALIAEGVPAVLLSATSVFASPLAMDWLTLLRTLDQPRAGTIRRAALTCFVGWTFTDLAGAGEGQLDRLTAQIRRWRRLLARRGVAALVEAITNDTDLNERLLGRVGGERALTDLRHIGQSLHATMQSGQLGVNALVEWLAERIDDARSHGLDGSRRLDTEARSVAVLTVHASKGLQFPIVYLPEAWDTYTGDDEGEALLLHERGDGSPDDCLLDVGGLGGSGRRDRLARARWEESGEDLRLLYVGLTRAQCQVVTWWAPSARNTAGSALHRLLYRERAALPLDAVGLGDGIVFQPAASYPVDVDPLRLDLGPHIALEPCEPRSPTTWQRAAEPPGGLSARTFDRTLDVEWRRTSYSALTAAAHGVVTAAPAVGSEPEAAVEDDEPIGTDPTAPDLARTAAGAPGLDQPSPMGGLPMGTEFGTAVHAVYEAIDPADEDLPAALLRASADALSRTSYARSAAAASAEAAAGADPERPALTAQSLADGLLPTLRTPLGPIADGLTLADIGARDRLAELEFELPLAGGDRPTADLRLGDVAVVLAEHLADDDPLAAYPALLADPPLGEQSLRGFLTGSIDAVLRIPSDGGPGQIDRRYLIVDYKTNWLGAFDGAELTLASYTPDRLAQGMMAAHYPLQALLYGVALHRLLRWRLPGYDPDRHLAGIAYLYVRGMAGPDTPLVDGAPCGVFGWRPPTGLVPALSDLLDRGADRLDRRTEMTRR